MAKKKIQKKKSSKAARPVKKPAKKAVRKVAAKKPVRKVAAKKPVRKPAPKKAAKKAVKKAAAKKLPLPKPAPASKPPVRRARPMRAFNKEELSFFRAHLQKQLDLVQSNLNALASDNLKRSPIEATGDISAHSTHMADQGTDNFDRELALNLASGRQESLYDIEDALRRIDDGSYGACESCGGAIERPRLRALPFAKKCLSCQNAAERGRTKYRPFGGTLPLQQIAAEDAAAEPAEPQG